MKRFLTVIAWMLVTMASHAQFYAGGSLGVTTLSTKQDGTSHTNATYTIAPEIGFRFNRILSAGVSGGVQYTVIGGGDDIVVYDLSPYLRTTFAHVSRVHFFADVAFSYQRTHSGTFDTSVNGWALSLNPGLLVDLSEHVQLMGRASLFQYAQSGKDEYKVKQTGFSIPTALAIGVFYHF